MGMPLFFDARRRQAIAQKFLEKFYRDEELPIARHIIQGIADELNFGKTIPALKTGIPALQGEIEALVKQKTGKMPCLCGARGVLIKRLPDGSVIPTDGKRQQSSPRHAGRSAGSEVDLGGDSSGPGTNGHIPRTRIVWTEEELAFLHDQIMEDWQKAPEEGLNLAVIIKAMHKILPEDRWRNFNTKGPVESVWQRAAEAMRATIEKAEREPDVRVEVREIRAPIDVNAVLEVAPLEVLSGVLARRSMQMQLRFFGVGGKEPPPPPKTIEQHGITSVKDIEALLPRVQVIGFRGTQHREMVERFKSLPVLIFPSIDPSAKLDHTLLVPNCTYLVDQTTATNDWRQEVIAHTEAKKSKRLPLSGPSRILDHIKTIAGDWAMKNPKLAAEWKSIAH